MWQRIQTLYLFLACGIIAALFFSPLAVAIGSAGVQENILFTDNTYFLILLIISALANFTALIMFKHRPFQMRCATLAALILIGFQIWLIFKYFNADNGIVFKFTALLPVIAAILDIMALKGILADEMMVASYNRLRSNKKNGKIKKNS